VLKVVIALEELELPFRFEMVDVFKGDQYEPRFQALTLNGKVPVIVDDDDCDEPLVIWNCNSYH
jgi:glutathione S-transferase